MADAFGSGRSGENRSVTDLQQQRSMLLILIAACKTAQTAFQAAHNPVDAELLTDLDRMIERSEKELRVITQRIQDAGSS